MLPITDDAMVTPLSKATEFAHDTFFTISKQAFPSKSMSDLYVYY